MIVQPYLNFGGATDEALAFYQRVLGAEVIMKMRFNEAPIPPDQMMVPPGHEAKVMHASFKVGDSILMASDGHCGGNTAMQGISLTITVADKAEAEKVFAALSSEGGQAQMPPTETFFSPAFGMLADKFGVHWMIVADMPNG